MVTHLLQRVHRIVFSAVFPSANNLLPRAARLMQRIVCLLYSALPSLCNAFRHSFNAENISKPYFGRMASGGGFLFLNPPAFAVGQFLFQSMVRQALLPGFMCAKPSGFRTRIVHNSILEKL